eukprot:3357123-Rhodomonas_salina.2
MPESLLAFAPARSLNWSSSMAHPKTELQSSQHWRQAFLVEPTLYWDSVGGSRHSSGSSQRAEPNPGIGKPVESYLGAGTGTRSGYPGYPDTPIPGTRVGIPTSVVLLCSRNKGQFGRHDSRFLGAYFV